MKSILFGATAMLLMSCEEKTDQVDMDADGIVASIDCDDNDPSLQAIGLDADCDGALTADDCDDADATLGARSEDQDCDGVRDKNHRYSRPSTIPSSKII